MLLKQFLRSGMLFYNIFFLLFFLFGCSSPYFAIPVDVPESALEKAVGDACQNEPFECTPDWIQDDWWTLFKDNQLDIFIEKALAQNPTLHAAQANILLANANANIIRSSLFPYISWNGDIAREKLSKTGIIPFGTPPAGTTVSPSTVGAPITPGGSSGIPVYFTQYETELNLTYEIDLWGKNRNRFAAAVGEVQAQIADEALKRLQLTILVAQVYFKLQTDYKREEIAKALVENQTQYEALVQKRLRGNLEASPTFSSARSNLSQVKQNLLQIQGDIAVNEYQLKAYLAGNFNEDISNTHILDAPLPKIPLPIELPLHLIAHRPDITEQLWIIYSAGKQIEVAKAGFYPDFNLNAFFGYQTIHLPQLFRWASSYFDINPAFSLPIFDAGRLVANLRGSEANYSEAIFIYNQLILNAAKEVLTAIAVLKNSNQQLQEWIKKRQAQESIFSSTKQKLKFNINSGLDYLTSEQTVLNAKDQEIVSLGNTIQAALSLIKALGGGYQTECMEG